MYTSDHLSYQPQVRHSPFTSLLLPDACSGPDAQLTFVYDAASNAVLGQHMGQVLGLPQGPCPAVIPVHDLMMQWSTARTAVAHSTTRAPSCDHAAVAAEIS